MSFEPKLVGFLCNWCSYTGADLAGTARMKYPPNLRVIRVMCSGRVDPNFVLEALARGADGVFIAGACQGPKDIPDTVAQGGAAAALAMSLMVRGEVEMDAACAVIDDKLCSGCKMCNDLCPFSAISFDDTLKVSSVNTALCKACGTCVAGCPSGAIRALHFSDEQVYAEIEGILV